MNSHLKVMTILGTRPEIIRLSRTLARLDEVTKHVLVHTGQNYDPSLNQIFFDDLNLRSPDYYLGCAGSSLGEMLGKILSETAKVIVDEKPDAVLVLGDTNSAIAAIIARRMKVPVYHMEAGNRSFDRNVPEETNRKVVDHIADFNLVYTEHARRHLLAEGLPHRRIYLTGSPMREVLEHYRPQIEASNILSELTLSPRGYFVVSLHREENVDNSSRLKALVQVLNGLALHYKMPIIVSTHPRTRQRLNRLNGILIDERVQFLEPFGFHDYNHLQMYSFCVISDSGTITEEASILGFPAVTPRDAIERPEGLDCGCVIMTGLNPDTVFDAVKVITASFSIRMAAGIPHPIPVDYCITNTSERVVNLIIGTARLSNGWDGIRENDLT